MRDRSTKNKEGALYELLTVAGERFEIRYGYYADYERERWEPMPVYPDFIKEPRYTAQGEPFATRTQDACESYAPRASDASEAWCADCAHFESGQGNIGVCKCNRRSIRNGKEKKL